MDLNGYSVHSPFQFEGEDHAKIQQTYRVMICTVGKIQMSHKHSCSEVISADIKTLKFWLKLYIHPFNISWAILLWKCSSYKHQNFHAWSNTSRSTNDFWNLLASTTFIFIWHLLIIFRRLPYFLPLGSGLNRIGKWERVVIFAPEEAPLQTWRFSRRNVSLRFENCIRIDQEYFPNASEAPNFSEVRARNYRQPVWN